MTTSPTPTATATAGPSATATAVPTAPATADPSASASAVPTVTVTAQPSTAPELGRVADGVEALNGLTQVLVIGVCVLVFAALVSMFLGLRK